MCADAKTYRPRIICEGVGFVVFVCGVRERVCVREREEKNVQLESVREQECVWLIQKLLTRTHTNTHTLSPSDWV